MADTAPDGLPPGGLARAYAKLKQGKTWAIVLLGILAAWLPLSPWIDPELGRINFFLSAEASLSQAVSYAGEMAVLLAILALLNVVKKLLDDVHGTARRLLELMEIERDAALADQRPPSAAPPQRVARSKPPAT